MSQKFKGWRHITQETKKLEHPHFEDGEMINDIVVDYYDTIINRIGIKAEQERFSNLVTVKGNREIQCDEKIINEIGEILADEAKHDYETFWILYGCPEWNSEKCVWEWEDEIEFKFRKRNEMESDGFRKCRRCNYNGYDEDYKQNCNLELDCFNTKDIWITCIYNENRITKTDINKNCPLRYVTDNRVYCEGGDCVHSPEWNGIITYPEECIYFEAIKKARIEGFEAAWSLRN